MKRTISALIAIFILLVVCAGCGKKDRILYNSGLNKNIELGNYKGIKIDTSSDDYKKNYDNIIFSDASNNNFFDEVNKTEGTVSFGDTVNIDYVGKKDGIAFDGGSATAQELQIGSNSFIDGFETGLIGKEIGSTVDLNLTFPKNYHSTDLAGTKVVFTVKINSVVSEIKKTETYYSELGFKSIDEYNANIKERAIKNLLLEKLKNNSKVKKYPKEVTETIYKIYRDNYDSDIQNQYGINLETYLQYSNQTEEDFKNSMIEEQIKPLIKEQMIFYSIFDKEKFELNDKIIDNKAKELIKQYNNENITEEKIKETYGDFYFEYFVVREKALDFVYESAKIS